MNGLHLFAVAGGSAITGGMGFLYHCRRKVAEANRSDWQSKTRNYNSSALGASGAVMGVGALTACLMPNAPMQLMLIPITFPLWGICCRLRLDRLVLPGFAYFVYRSCWSFGRIGVWCCILLGLYEKISSGCVEERRANDQKKISADLDYV